MHDTLETQKINTEFYAETVEMQRVLAKMCVESHQLREVSILNLLDRSHLDLIPKAILSTRAEEVKMNANSGHGESDDSNESIPCNQIREDFLASFLTHEIISPSNADRCAEIKFKNQQTGEIDLEVHLHGEFHSPNKIAVAALSFCENSEISTTARVLLWKFLANHEWEMGKSEREDIISLNLQQQVDRLNWLWGEYVKTDDALNNSYEDPAIARFVNSPGIEYEIGNMVVQFADLIENRKYQEKYAEVAKMIGVDEVIELDTAVVEAIYAERIQPKNIREIQSHHERGGEIGRNIILAIVKGEFSKELMQQRLSQQDYTLLQVPSPSVISINSALAEGIKEAIFSTLSNTEFTNKIDPLKLISALCDLQGVSVSEETLEGDILSIINLINSQVDLMQDIPKQLGDIGIGHRELSILLNAGLLFNIEGLDAVVNVLNENGFFAINLRQLTDEEHAVIAAGQYHLLANGDMCPDHAAKVDSELIKANQNFEDELKNAPDINSNDNQEVNSPIAYLLGGGERILNPDQIDDSENSSLKTLYSVVGGPIINNEPDTNHSQQPAGFSWDMSVGSHSIGETQKRANRGIGGSSTKRRSFVSSRSNAHHRQKSSTPTHLERKSLHAYHRQGNPETQQPKYRAIRDRREISSQTSGASKKIIERNSKAETEIKPNTNRMKGVGGIRNNGRRETRVNLPRKKKDVVIGSNLEVAMSQASGNQSGSKVSLREDQVVQKVKALIENLSPDSVQTARGDNMLGQNEIPSEGIIAELTTNLLDKEELARVIAILEQRAQSVGGTQRYQIVKTVAALRREELKPLRSITNLGTQEEVPTGVSTAKAFAFPPLAIAREITPGAVDLSNPADIRRGIYGILAKAA